MAFALPLKTEPCLRLLAYWNELRGDALLPKRADLDPSGFLEVLPYISILEVRDRDTMIYRLCGTGLRDILGFEATGCNLLDLVSATARPVRAYRNWVAATRPCMIAYEVDLTYPSGAIYAHEGISLPLAPRRPDAPPLLLRAFAPIPGEIWYNRAAARRGGADPSFRFVDIGAGTAASIHPAGDFLAPEPVPA